MLRWQLKWVLTILGYSMVQAQPGITVFIHGTLPPLLDKLVHQFDCPLGIQSGHKNRLGIFHARITDMLATASPVDFAASTIYFFGWSGSLSFSARRQAAHELYCFLRNRSGPIRIIGHSHGGNVALELATIARLNHNTTLCIDELVLLAVPVQGRTAESIKEPLFKHIYSFYSQGDLIQVLDPQGLYGATHRSVTQPSKSFFSLRVFEPHTKLVQVRVFNNKLDLWHIDFILPLFIKQLPALLELARAHKQKRTVLVQDKPDLLVSLRGDKAPEILLVEPTSWVKLAINTMFKLGKSLIFWR